MSRVKETTKNLLEPERQDILRVTLGDGDVAFTLLYRLRDAEGGAASDTKDLTVFTADLTVEQQAVVAAIWTLVVAKTVTASGPFTEQ